MAKGKPRRQKPTDPILDQLDQIKRLIMLQLIASGVKAKDIALVLEVDNSVVSRIVPARLLKKVSP